MTIIHLADFTPPDGPAPKPPKVSRPKVMFHDGRKLPPRLLTLTETQQKAIYWRLVRTLNRLLWASDKTRDTALRFELRRRAWVVENVLAKVAAAMGRPTIAYYRREKPTLVLLSKAAGSVAA